MNKDVEILAGVDIERLEVYKRTQGPVRKASAKRTLRKIPVY
jgi:hypothetical protein